MPHIIVEFNHDLIAENQIDAMLQHLFDGLVGAEIFKEQNIKMRAQPRTHVCLQDQNAAFMHIQVRTHVGRDDETLAKVSRCLADAAQDYLNTNPPLKKQDQAMNITITCEMVIMNTPIYAKAKLSL